MQDTNFYYEKYCKNRTLFNSFFLFSPVRHGYVILLIFKELFYNISRYISVFNFDRF